MFKLFRNFNKSDILKMLVCFLLVVFQVWLDLRMPEYMSAITRLIQTEGSEMS